MGNIQVNEKITRHIHYFPCIECGSNDIDFNDCGYSSFNVAWGRCKGCKNEVKIPICDYNISKEEIIEVWNKSNDPEIVRAKIEQQIIVLQSKLNALP